LVFRCAIRHNATAVVLAHNHPSGDPQPSAEDIRITRQLIDAGRVLGIPVQDHIVIGRTSHLSLRETGMCDFTSKE
jgi:DNA repair protein RadC